MSDLFMLLAEGAGPHVVIESISEGMQKSKVPLQQKAALSILLRLVNEFGAFALDLKLLFSYIKSDQCLLNSHVEVKNQAIEVLCVLYKQLGAVVRSLVEQSGISDLLKKSVMDSLDAVAYDPSAAAAYSAVSSAVSSATSNASGAVAQTASGSAQGVGAVSQGAMKPAVISVNDLIEPQDISGEVRPLLKKLATVEGKEAWKERQQGVLELTALLKQKVHEGPCTSVSVNQANGHLLATSGEDGFVRLWEVSGSELKMVSERDMNLGNVFNCSFYESQPYLLAACGTSQDLCLWDIREVDALAGIFDNPVEASAEKVTFEASGDATGTLNDIKKKRK